MATNLLELAQSYITRPVTEQISGLLGEGEAATQSAISAALPSLFSGLIKQASTPGGSSGLAASLDGLDTGFLGNLGASLGGSGAQKLMETGSGLVKNLFGGSVDTVAGGIGKATGLGKGAMRSLLGLMAPIVMGVLAKQKKTQGLDADGLSHLLVDQEPFVSSALPSGVKAALGLGIGLETAADTDAAGYPAGRAAYDSGRSAVGSATRATVEPVQRRSWIASYWPALLLALFAFFAWRLLSTSPRAASPPSAAAPIDSLRQQVTGAFQSVTAALTNVRDEASARSALPAIESATRSISNVTAGVEAMPQSTRDGIAQLVRNMLPGLQSLTDKALAIPGVMDVLRPAITPFMIGLTKLRA